MADITRICVIGGGASGIGLLWSLAMASRAGTAPSDYEVTLVHREAAVGGHSVSKEVELGGQNVHIDCGVQMIAPKMYPVTMSMLALPDFAAIAMQDVPLKIGCVFPDDQGVSQYWGNFPAYQQTPLARNGHADANTFAELLKAKLSVGFGIEMLESLETMLDRHRDQFEDVDRFTTYFLDAYMSIMNGYGNALLGTVIVGDVAPLWDLGYASFTSEVTGYGRFKDGADSWVRRMWQVAQAEFGSSLTARFNTTVEQLYPSDDGPTVIWKEPNGTVSPPQVFDAVVSTIDMHTNSTILDVPANHLWSEVFEPRVGTVMPGKVETTVWPLQPGFCALHQDTSVLASHDGPQRLETLQFNGKVGAIDGGPKFDLSKTFSTYIESNLMGVPVENPEEDFYLTMYGYDPGGDAPDHQVWSSDWNHGMWLPSFMVSEKLHFHRAQGVSRFHKAHHAQRDTGIFFAGNNLTMDSEEGALVSGMAIAKYAFGVDPMAALEPGDGSSHDALELAKTEFDLLYGLLMFPSKLEEVIGAGVGALEYLFERWLPIWGPGRP